MLMNLLLSSEESEKVLVRIYAFFTEHDSMCSVMTYVFIDRVSPFMLAS